MEDKEYLQNGARIWAECYLLYDKDNNRFMFDGIEGDAYYKGESVEFNEEEKPYIEI